MTAIQQDAQCVLDADGTLAIPDADGEAHRYLIDPCGPGFDLWACTIRRLDTGATYRVAVTQSGQTWRCSCLDSIYRAKKLHRACKHCSAAAPFYLQLRKWLEYERQERDRQREEAGQYQ